MVVNKKDITNLVKRLLHTEAAELQKPKLIHPARDWSIGVLVAILLFIANAAWSAHSYVLYKDIAVIETEAITTETPIYRKQLVETALQALDEREQHYQTILRAATTRSAPVLPADVSTSTSAVPQEATSTLPAGDVTPAQAANE